MRDQIKALEKELASLKTENEALASKARLADARELFREAGYNPRHAELFVSTDPEELSVDAVVTFVQTFDLPVPETSKTETEETKESEGGEGTPVPPTPTTTELAAMGGGTTRAGEGSTKAITGGKEPMPRQEWIELYRRDPERAKVIAEQEGRVQLRPDNPFAVHRSE
jgi:hypothetical protein